MTRLLLALLFDGLLYPDGTTDPADSPVYADLSAWQANDLLPGPEAGSVEEPGGARPSTRAATRFGVFPVGE